MRIHKYHKQSALKYAEKVVKKLHSDYQIGDYNFRVLKFIGSYDANRNFIFRGDTSDVTIYDTMKDSEGKPLNYVIEWEGIKLIEIFCYPDNDNNYVVYKVDKFTKDLTKKFKWIAYQIINGNYLEQGK